MECVAQARFLNCFEDFKELSLLLCAPCPFFPLGFSGIKVQQTLVALTLEGQNKLGGEKAVVLATM